MNILRQPPFPLTVEYSGLEASTAYIVQIYNDHASLIFSNDVESDQYGVVTQELPNNFSKFDETYALYIYSVDESEEADEVVVMDNLYIYRPYINPETLAETPGEIEEYTTLERTARQIIDTIVGGFYYSDSQVETTGLGADYLPIPKRINKINHLYENNVLVYNRFDTSASANPSVYFVTADHSAITIAVSGTYNRSQYKDVTLPIAASDSFQLYGDDYDAVQALTKIKGASMFPQGYDYVLYGEFGWPVVPQDIKDATRMLIEDLKCNKLSYINRYITEYQTDQFKVKYGDLASRGTGNLLVDKILESYSIPLYNFGVI